MVRGPATARLVEKSVYAPRRVTILPFTFRWRVKCHMLLRSTTAIPASAQEIYDAWLDSLAHSEMTGGEADMSDEIDAEVSAWDGYITGRNLELIPGERIVQSWRTTQFAEEHHDSIITLTV